MKVSRVERHIVDSTEHLVALSFASKNLYNCATFIMRQNFIFNQKIINYGAMDKIIKRDYPDVYYALPCQTCQQILRVIEKDWKSFFSAHQSYKENPSKFTGRPKLPNYKDKEKGQHSLIFTNQQCKIKAGFINFPKAVNLPLLKTMVDNLQQVRIIPKYKHFVIEVVYKKSVQPYELNKENILGIDLGLNNLATLVSNQPAVAPMLINGRPLKSINQFFNKRKAELMSYIGDQGESNRIADLSRKRNQKINDYLHKASTTIIEYAIETNTGLIVVGSNDHWKQTINIGKKNNQNFVSVPFEAFKSMLTYKCEDNGIDIVFTEESYTSKASALDNDTLPTFKKGVQHAFTGRRVKRGLYKWSGGLINADLNGALNIIRKVVPESLAELIETRNRGIAFMPFKVYGTF